MKRLILFCALALLLVGCGGRAEEPGQIAYIPAATEAPQGQPPVFQSATGVPSQATAAPASDVPLPTAAPLFTPVPTAAPTLAPTAEPVPTDTPVPTEAPMPTDTPAPTLPPTEARLRQYVDGMTDKEKIGQLVMFGFSGTKTVSSEFAKIMADNAVGNVILYGANISRGDKDGGFDRCAALTKDIRAHMAVSIPPLISIDVEGGNVTRFRWRDKTESAGTLGKRGDEAAAQLQFERIATALRDVGINTDLAPVLDVAQNPSKSFLGSRIISGDEQVAARIGAACIDGVQSGGCLSVVKHFPGHGATSVDSHDKTPVVKKSLAALRAYDIYPFEQAVDAGVDGVMVAHILYPEVDPQYIATQSEIIMNDLLRGELGFEGIILADDFRMNGLRSQASLEQAAVRFILAGGDIILCGANHSYQRSILKGLTAAVADGTISRERLDESVLRILRAKMVVTDWMP